MTTLYLIRHGETANNKAACFNGCKSNQPLNERGKAQSLCLGRALITVNFDAIYCSPLQRAIDTAAALCGTRALSLQIKQEIKEMDMGELDGVTYEEARRIYPDISENWTKNPDAVKMPNGESFAEVLARALPAVFEIVRSNRDKTVAVVAHGTLLRLVMTAFLGLPVARKGEVEHLVNTGYYRLLIEDDGRVTVTAYNHHSHLPKELLPTKRESLPSMLGRQTLIPELKRN